MDGDCIKCGKCVTVCPLYSVGRTETASPRGMLALIEHFDREDICPSRRTRAILSNCFFCGRCNICPTGVVPSERIADALIRYGGTPYREKRRRRIARRITPIRKAETLVFVGCILERNPSLLKDCLKKMSSMFSNYTLAVGYCCGAPFLPRGDEERLLFSMARLLRLLHLTRAKRIITLCPLCAVTLKRNASRYSLPIPETLFITEAVRPQRIQRLPRTVFYFSGCVSEASGYGKRMRKVMEKAGVRVVGNDGMLCCGNGVGDAPVELRRILFERLLSEWRATGRSALITDCPRCLLRLKEARIPLRLSLSLLQ